MWKEILKAFVQELKKDDKIEGVILIGDRAIGYFDDEDEDIEIGVLVNKMEEYDNGPFLEEVKGFKFVYHVYTLEQIKERFASDYRKFLQTTAINLLTGKILYDAYGNLDTLKTIALEYKNKPYPALKNIKKMKTNIEFIGRDLIKATSCEDFDFKYYRALDKIFTYYLNYIGVSYYPDKTFRYMADHVYAKEYLYPEIEDKIFKNFVIKALTVKEKSEKLAVIENLIKHVLLEIK